jgi:hypothetical protein
LFKTHLERTHHHYTDSKTDPPDHTIVIESVLMTKSKEKYSESFHNFIFNSIGDAEVETSYNTHYDPALRLHTGCPLMMNNNTELDTLNIGKGTLCRFVGVKIKQGKTSYVKIINNRKVNAISEDDIEYIVCEHWKSENNKPPKRFQITPTTQTVKIKTTPELKGIKMKQLVFLKNRATTGNKLQEMSIENIIVVDYDFKTLNWVYVVLSRVRTRNKLFLYHKLHTSKIKQPDQALIKDNKRMMEIEKNYYIKKNKIDSLTVIIQTNKHNFIKYQQINP